MNKIAKERGLDLTDPRQRRRANSLARKNAAKGNVNNPMGRKKKKKLLAASYEPIVVSEKRKISDMEKKLYNRQKPSSDMITARPGEAKKQNKLVDRYSKKYKTPKQKNETHQFLKGIARGEVHQEGSLHKWFSGSKLSLIHI